MIKMFINGIGSVHPAINNEQVGENPHLCEEPDLKKFLDPVSSRRLSKILKRSLFASNMALNEAGIVVPDAIITGTGLGCLEDTEKFLTNVLEDESGALSPTSFIQSTHNTISGQIALMVKCHGYNTTYSQRSISFEQAVEDAVMWLREGELENILVGAVDEIPSNVLQIARKIGLYKSWDSKKNIPIAGEGAYFFALSNRQGPSCHAQLKGVQYCYGSKDISQEITGFLSSMNLPFEQVDAIITGCFQQPDHWYGEVLSLFHQAWHIQYKHVIGDSFTATGFAWNLACEGLRNDLFPSIFVQKESERNLKHVLVYNHFLAREHSFVLLSHV